MRDRGHMAGKLLKAQDQSIFYPMLHPLCYEVPQLSQSLIRTQSLNLKKIRLVLLDIVYQSSCKLGHSSRIGISPGTTPH